MNRLIVMALLVATFICASAWCDEHIAGVLTLEDCFRLLEDRNPQLKAAQENIDAAELRYRMAFAQKLPSLSAVASYSVVSDVMEMETPAQTIPLPAPTGPLTIPGRTISFGDEDVAELRLTVGYAIYTGGKISWNTRLSSVQAGLAYMERERIRQDLRARLRLLYFQFLKAGKAMEIIQEDVSRSERHLDEAKNRQKQGMAIRMDVLEAQITLGQTRQELIRIGNEKEQARLALLSILEFPEDSPITFSEEQWSRPPEDSELPEQDIPLTRRPEIGVADLEVSAAQMGVALAESSRKPTVMFEGSGCVGRPGLDAVQNEWMTYATAGLRLNFDLYRGGGINAQVQEKQKLVQATESRRQALERQIKLDRQSAWLTVATAKGNWELAAQIVGTAEERFRVVESMWREGLATETAYQDAREAMTQSRLSLSAAILDYRVAIAESIRANGEMENHNSDIEQTRINP